jgi:hypothetical protein
MAEEKEPRRSDKAGEAGASAKPAEKHGGGYEHGRHKYGGATEVSSSETKRKAQ